MSKKCLIHSQLHGLSSNKIVVLAGESEAAWEEYQTHFIAKFQPRDFVEERLVIQMAVNQWRLERVWSLQTATVDEESATQEELIEAKYEEWDTALVHACSYNARKVDLKALDQYESRFVRNFDRALRQFNQIREQYPPQPVSENEPETEPQVEPEIPNPEIAKVENEPETPEHIHVRPAAIHVISNEISPSIAINNPKSANLPDFPLVA